MPTTGRTPGGREVARGPGLIVRAGLLGLAYFLAARFGLLFLAEGEHVTFFWPPSGLLLAALAVSNRRAWPTLLAAAAAAGAAAHLLAGKPLEVGAGLAAAHALEAWLGAWLLARAFPGPVTLANPREVFGLILLPGCAACAATALPAAAVVTAGPEGRSFWSVWAVWWAGDTLGVVLVAPAVLTWAGAGRAALTGLGWRAAAEATLLFTALAVLASLIYTTPAGGLHFLVSMPFPLFPLLLWAALRFGVRGTALAVPLLALIAVWGTANGQGPFAVFAAAPRDAVLLVQAYAAVVSLFALVLAAVIRERDEKERRLRDRENDGRRHLAELAHVARLSTLGEMASGFAHELNQPLTGILTHAQGCLHRLRRGACAPEQLTEALERVAAQAERAGAVIRRLRHFVRRREPHRSTLDLNELVREVLGLADNEVRRCEARVRLELDEELPPVLADRIQIEQVLLNLVRNALEAMDDVPAAARALTIRARVAGAEVEVAVRDTGPGLAPGAVPLLFTPFFTTKPHGMGLGLSISRSIVEAHEGRLEARPGDGPGATFCFTLPLGCGEPVHDDADRLCRR